MLMVAIPRVMVIEDALGMTEGHRETRALVEHFLAQLEGPRRPSLAGLDRGRLIPGHAAAADTPHELPDLRSVPLHCF
jgi:hypothetical protein